MKNKNLFSILIIIIILISALLLIILILTPIGEINSCNMYAQLDNGVKCERMRVNYGTYTADECDDGRTYINQNYKLVENCKNE